jgi:hypothetical protein
MRHDTDLDLLCIALAVEAQTHVLVNKADKGLHSVQEGFNLKLNS